MPDRTATSSTPVAAARLWRQLWRQLAVQDQRRLVAAGVVMLVSSALTAVLPVLIGDLVDRSLSGGSISLRGAAGPLGAVAALAVAAQLLQVVRRQLVENVATGFERDSRQRAYGHIIRLDLDRFRHGQIGSIYGRANRSVEGAVRLVKLGAMDLVPALTLAVSALVVAFTRNPVVAAAMAMVIPTGFALVYWQVTNQAGIRLRVRDHKEAIDGQVVELLPAMEVVRATGADDLFMKRVREVCGRLRSTELTHHRAMSLFDAGKAINEAAWLIATLATAIALTAAGRISAGEVVTYVLLYAGVTAPLRDLHRIIDEAAESAQQTDDLLALLDEDEDESYRHVAAGPLGVTGGPAAALTISGLSFTHRNSSTPTIDALTLQAAPGERIGVVGASGCGKSTLLKLIARLHHGFGGVIRLHGRDIRAIDHEELVGLVGYVAQEPRLFRGTIAENITLARADATREEVVRAARRAHVHQDVMRMPDGYDTQVAERGDTLSGGQRQRLCLARALLRTPPMLLLDEPTSALDGPSQAAVQKAIDDLEDVTMIVVAHRLSTLRTMDRIVVMDAGRLVQTGTFGELASRPGLFADMLRSQGEAA